MTTIIIIIMRLNFIIRIHSSATAIIITIVDVYCPIRPLNEGGGHDGGACVRSDALAVVSLGSSTGTLAGSSMTHLYGTFLRFLPK